MNIKMKKKSFNTLLLLFLISSTGCVSFGQKLNYEQVATIQRNITTERDIRTMFGEPVSSEINLRNDVKILTYGYKNNESIKQAAAGATGAVIGGVLGGQVGGGSGSEIASGLGSLAGAVLASNAVKSRKEKQYLEVTIGLTSKKVVDFNYVEYKGRTQRIGINSGVSPL